MSYSDRERKSANRFCTNTVAERTAATTPMTTNRFAVLHSVRFGLREAISHCPNPPTLAKETRRRHGGGGQVCLGASATMGAPIRRRRETLGRGGAAHGPRRPGTDAAVGVARGGRYGVRQSGSKRYVSSQPQHTAVRTRPWRLAHERDRPESHRHAGRTGVGRARPSRR